METIKRRESDLTTQPSDISEKAPTMVDNLIETSAKLSRADINEMGVSNEVFEELKSKHSTDELDLGPKTSMKRKSVVPLTKAQANEAFTHAMDTVLAEVEKNQSIAQLVELKVGTLLALTDQGVSTNK
jgi:hypothetical protein